MKYIYILMSSKPDQTHIYGVHTKQSEAIQHLRDCVDDRFKWNTNVSSRYVQCYYDPKISNYEFREEIVQYDEKDCGEIKTIRERFTIYKYQIDGKDRT